MDLPTYQAFMRPILEVLSNGSTSSRQAIINATLAKFNFSEEDLALRHEHGGSLLLAGRVGWALTHMTQAGLVDSPARATYCITEAGMKAVKSREEINNDYLNRFEAFREFIRKSRKRSDTKTAQRCNEVDNEVPLEKINQACEALEAALKQDVIKELLKLTETAFECFCVDLLVKMGYGNLVRSRVTPPSGDGGIDGIVTSDRLGFDKVYVQAKLYSPDNSIPDSTMRDFIGAIDNQESNGRGVFITTSKFTKGAVDKAQGSKHHKIVLIDGDKLASLMIEYGVGVTTTETYTVKELNPSFFGNYEQK